MIMIAAYLRLKQETDRGISSVFGVPSRKSFKTFDAKSGKEPMFKPFTITLFVFSEIMNKWNFLPQVFFI